MSRHLLLAISQSHPLQLIAGCSRHSGRRRVIDALQRRADDDPTRLVGLRLAGTRVAYVRGTADSNVDRRITVIADDAVHGGRRHDLGAEGWPFDGGAGQAAIGSVPEWTLNADGDVAWIAAGPPDRDYGMPAPSLLLWHAGLGVRQVDAKAGLRGLTLAGHVLSWRRNGAPRTLDLAAIPRSACAGTWPTGTLDVDLRGPVACLRATGRAMTVPLPYGGPIVPVDINGPYILVNWIKGGHSSSLLVDLVNGTAQGYVDVLRDAVVDAHGSMAWLVGSTLWVLDAGGLRTIPGRGTDGLTRDGSTVTWPGGPTVTLDP